MEINSHLSSEILFRTPIADLPAICSTNSIFSQICSSFEFWRERYARNGLLLLSKFDNLTDYSMDYQVCSNILSSVSPLSDLLRTRLPTNDDDPPELFFLSTYVNNLSEFNFPEVNLSKVRRMNLRLRKHWSKTSTEQTSTLIGESLRGNRRRNTQSILIGLPVEFYYSTTYSKWVLNFVGMEIDKEDGGEEEDYSVFLSELTALTFIYSRIYWDSSFKIEIEEVGAFALA